MELGKYMQIDEVSVPAERKTKRWQIISSNEMHAVLGYVAWFGRWRQYCFHPCAGTIFNGDCLLRINEFLERMNREHRGQVAQ